MQIPNNISLKKKSFSGKNAVKLLRAKGATKTNASHILVWYALVFALCNTTSHNKRTIITSPFLRTILAGHQPQGSPSSSLVNT